MRLEKNYSGEDVSIKVEDILNWTNLSLRLTGNPKKIQKSKVPLKYKPVVNAIILLLRFALTNKITKID